MQHFQLIDDHVDVSEINAQLTAHPELWNVNGSRRQHTGSAHTQTSDIWIRYNSIERLDLNNPAAFNEEHVPVWYPAWDALPALRPVIFDLMAKAEGEMLGGVLITKVPPGGRIAPHRDDGWHVQYYDKFYLSLKSAPGADFGCQHDGVTERLNPKTGDIWLFDNRKLHWVENTSDQDRITLIVCIRTQKYKR